MAPDTNINAASDAEFIYINGLPFRRGATGRASSGIGIVGWGGGEYQYPLAERWRLRSGSERQPPGVQGEPVGPDVSVRLRGAALADHPDTEVSLLATASQRWWGGSSLNYDYGARLEVEHRVFAGLRLSGRALWSDRKYQQQKFLEGPLMVFSLGARYVLFPTVQVNALVGYQQQDAVFNALEQCRATGRGSGRTWRCRGGLPWASAPSSGGRITNPGGFRSSRITLRPARTRPASCRPRC